MLAWSEIDDSYRDFHFSHVCIPPGLEEIKRSVKTSQKSLDLNSVMSHIPARGGFRSISGVDPPASSPSLTFSNVKLLRWKYSSSIRRIFRLETPLWVTSGRSGDVERCPLYRQSGHSAIHSITSSAAISKPGGTVKPSAFAVLRLTTVSNFVGVCTGRSAGFAPRRMLST
jgi:hypothetical protein